MYKVYQLFLIVLSYLSLNNNVYSQTPTVQDCPGAIPVCQSVYSQTNSYSGVGNIPGEITGSISCLSGEVNGAWYTFTVQQGGNLCFSITPNNMSDDYDWAVYNLTNNSCADIATTASLQVSCNFSGASGITGANGLGGSQNNPCIPVNQGETYSLYVSNWTSSPFGYTLDLAAAGSNAIIFDTVSPNILQIPDYNLCSPLSQIEINFSENVICSSINAADYQLINLSNGNTLNFVSLSSPLCDIGADYDNSFVFTLTNPISQSGDYIFCAINTNAVDLCGNLITTQCDTFEVNITNNISVSFSTQSVTCFNDNNGSATATAANGAAPYNYLWNTSPGQTGQTANNLASGTYTVNITDANGCGFSDTVNISDISTPIIHSSSVQNTTCGLDNGSININITGGFPPYNYTFNGSSSNSYIDSLSPGSYNFNVSDSVNCTINFSENVAASPLPDISILTKDSSDVVCFDDQIILRAFGGISYEWYPNNNLSDTVGVEIIASPNNKTTIYVEGTVPGGCTGIDSIVIKPNSEVEVISDKDVTCPPDTINFNHNGNNLNNCSWLLNGVATQLGCGSIDIPFIQSGFNEVSFEALDVDGCDVTSNFLPIDIRPLPFASFIADPENTTIFNSNVNFTNNSSLSSIIYEWYLDSVLFSSDFEPNYFFTDTGLFSVQLIVTSADGCQDSIRKNVYIDSEVTLYIPNAFTPDGDGLNDFFYVEGENLEDFSYNISIFNRWGNLVFKSDDVNEKWNGTFLNKGDILPIGVYSYKLILEQGSTSNQYIGTVTIYNKK